MHFRIWDTNPQIIDQFVQEAKELGSIDIYENISDLLDDIESTDCLVFEYNKNSKQAKQIDKALKNIRNKKLSNIILFIYDTGIQKQIVKHQNSKYPADNYLSLPVSLSLLSSILGLEIIKEEVEENEISKDTIDESLHVDIEDMSENEDLTIPSLPPMPSDPGDEKQETLEPILQEIPEFNQKDTTLENEMSPKKNQDERLSQSVGDETLEELIVEDEIGLSFEDTNLDVLGEADELDLGLDISEDKELSLGEEDVLEDFSLSDDESEAEGLSLEEDALSSSDDTGLDLGISEDIGLEFGESEDILLGDLEEDGDSDLSDSQEETVEMQNQDGLEIEMGDNDLSLDFSSDAVELDSVDDLFLDEGDNEQEEAEDLELSDSAGDLEIDSQESDGFEFNDSDNLDLSDDLSFGTEDEVGAGEFGELEMSSDLSDDLSANDLPISPIGGEEFKFDNHTSKSEEIHDTTGDLSEDALAKLAEIDQMLQEDATSSSLSTQDLNDDYHDEDYDPTAQDEALLDTIQEINDDRIIEPEPELTQLLSTASNSAGKQHSSTVSTPDDGVKSDIYNEELIRLSETISLLRTDREELLNTISNFEKKEEGRKDNDIFYRAQIDEKNIELSVIKKRYETRLTVMEKELNMAGEKNDLYHEKIKRLEHENEKLKKENNYDLMRIKNREKELENQLELLKADSSAQIVNRDQKILQLKRRIDTLEFDLDAIQTREKRMSDDQFAIEDRMEKVINTLRNAIGDLEDETSLMSNSYSSRKKNIDI